MVTASAWWKRGVEGTQGPPAGHMLSSRDRCVRVPLGSAAFVAAWSIRGEEDRLAEAIPNSVLVATVRERRV